MGDAVLEGRRAERAARDHLRGLRGHRGEQRVDAREVEARETGVEALHHLVGHRRAQEADGAADPRAGRHEHPPHADLLAHAVAVHRAAAAERDDGAALVGFRALHRVHARGVGHVLVHHLHHAERGHRGVEPEPRPDMGRERALRRRRVEPQRAARERLGVVAAEREVRVRHRRPQAAAPVASRPRVGPRAFRPDLDQAQRIHLREAAAARADLHHLDHRDAQRQA